MVGTVAVRCQPSAVARSPPRIQRLLRWLAFANEVELAFGEHTAQDVRNGPRTYGLRQAAVKRRLVAAATEPRVPGAWEEQPWRS